MTGRALPCAGTIADGTEDELTRCGLRRLVSFTVPRAFEPRMRSAR